MAALLLVGGSVLACAGEDGPRPDGPLRFGGGDSVSSIVTRPGATIAFGANLMHNAGDGEVRLLDARLLDGRGRAPVPSQVDVRAVRVIETEALGLDYLGVGPWPFEDLDQHDQALSGHVLRTDGLRVELLVVIEVRASGEWLYPEVEVDYEHDGDRYTATSSNGLAICSDGVDACDPAALEG